MTPTNIQNDTPQKISISEVQKLEICQYKQFETEIIRYKH